MFLTRDIFLKYQVYFLKEFEYFCYKLSSCFFFWGLMHKNFGILRIVTEMNQEKPTIAHFVSQFLFLTGSWIYTQLINLKSYRSFVLTLELENQEQFPFEDVYCYSQPVKGNRLWQIAMRKVYEAVTHSQVHYFTDVILTQRTRLLHAHFGTEGYYRLGLQQKVSLPLITTFYGADMSKLPNTKPKWRKRYRFLFEVGSLFLAEGPYMAQALVDLGCPPQKVRVQHLGVDMQRITFKLRQIQKGEPVRILMASSFREKKGIPFGIKAFARAVCKFSNMELRIIGGAITANDHRLMTHCRRLALNEGVADKVNFLGYLLYKDYLNEIDSAHVFMAPSIRASDGDTEGGAPVSIIEASAAGMPVIATYHCDIPNVIIDGETGLLVPECDIQTLTEAILMLADSPDSWIVMGKAGRNRVEKEFNVIKQVLRLEKIYKEFI